MLDEAVADEQATGPVRNLARNFADHIQEEIVGNSNVQGMVRELWRTHPNAMRLAVKHRPCLRDFEHRIREQLARTFDEALLIRKHPEDRGDPCEIKVSPESWWNGGMPLTFMIHEDGRGRACVRLVVGRNVFAAVKDRLEAWADTVAASDAELTMAPHFPRWGWWYDVLLANDTQAGTVVDEIWHEEAAVAAVACVREWVEALRASVEAHLVAAAEVPYDRASSVVEAQGESGTGVERPHPS